MSRIGGTQINVGIGIESAAGTPVAASYFPKWTELSLQGVSEKSMFNGQRGIRNASSNSIIKRKYGKGSIGVIPNPKIVPMLYYLALGSLSSSSIADSAYTHTISVQNANASMKTGTVIIERGSEVVERFSNCVVNQLTLSVTDDFAKLTANLIGGYPDNTTLTESFAQETEFSYSQMLARFGTSLSNAAGAAATTTITSDATNVADGDTVTIGSTVYTFKTTLTSSGTVPYEVLIGVDAATSLDNIKLAINANGTAGTDYGTGTLAHPTVFATTNGATTQVIQARQSGTAANAIATTTTSAHLSWPGATVNAGTPGTGPNPTPLKAFTLTVDNQVDETNAYLSGSNTPIAGGFVAGQLKVTGSYTLPFDTAAEYNRYLGNTKQALIITLTGAMIGAASQELVTINLGKLILTGEPIQVTLGGLTMIQQAFEVEYDATDKEIGVVVVNTVASY